MPRGALASPPTKKSPEAAVRDRVAGTMVAEKRAQDYFFSRS